MKVFMYIRFKRFFPKGRPSVPVRLRVVLLMVALAAPSQMLGSTEPRAQQFLITAYYSPLPGQCCYVRGGLHADRDFNGQGVLGADGTPVYPGMIAAPPSYAFGTVVELPGIGTFSVHDRGGAITELPGDVHRLDIWVGHGEEGLARALAFGIRDARGTVYPPGTEQPRESFALDSLPVSHAKLSVFSLHAGDILSLTPREGDRSLSVRILQDHLKSLGYFTHAVTGYFGETTLKSFHAFLRDFGLPEDSVLTERAAAFLKAAVRRSDASPPIARDVDSSSAPGRIAEVQRLLRFLAYFRGRSDGVWSDAIASSILKFQIDSGVIADAGDVGAGRVGPATREALLAAWNRAIISRRAEDLLALHAIEEGRPRISRFFGEGENGENVRILQGILADAGFFPTEEINGNFGPRTKHALTEYQISRGVIESSADTGAGYVGPATLSSLRYEQRQLLYRLAREKGWTWASRS